MFVLENFKNIPRSPYGGRHGSNVIFFFFKFATKSLEEKKRGGMSSPQRATGPCRPPGATVPVARWGGGATGPPLFFLQGLICKFEEKKITFDPCRPPIGRPGYIFEIFQNGHIFLKF